ncbi:MAG: sugar transferase [Geminicoccaceae bacterium]|jgi:lipopolysaccharide/colanic/teichoic acid biosynthesis glycosyltransferase|nr:sugar transferase [Geminicoccaceae bacterium]
MESLPTVADQLTARVPTPPARPARRPAAPGADAGRFVDRPRHIDTVRDADTAVMVENIIPAARSDRLNRAVNLTISLLGLVLLSPLLLAIALAVKLTSRGPIFYTQTRVGIDRRWRRTLAMHERRLQDLGGAAFTIYKFRSMYMNAEGPGGAVWATVNDPRVTPVGRVLRKFRLDELPQLINVVKGDMNIVGPRPERPLIVARLRQDIPEYPMRHRVKPGITGLAQINRAYDSCLDDVREKVRYDLEYLRTQSMFADITIMLKTMPTVLLKIRGW